MNLACHLERIGLAHPERPAVARGAAVVLRYGALAERATRLAGALRGRLGLKPGDRVALLLTNCVQYLEILYGCWHAGLVAVPVNGKLHARELAYIIAHSGARLSLANRELAERIGGLEELRSHPIVTVDGTEYEPLFSAPPSPLVERAPEDPAWIFYTSGTTGRPKGAVLSHRNLLAMTLCYFADVDREPPWRAILHAAPMSHGSGLYGLAHVLAGSCHVIAESGAFDPEELHVLIDAWPGAVFFAAPTMIRRLVDHPSWGRSDNLKCIIYGGGPMYLDDLLAALDRLGPKFVQIYGQGESPMTITALGADVIRDQAHPRWRERLGSVGIAQSAVEVRVVSERNEPLGPGAIGEVVVRGDTVMRGYWENPSATAETLRGGWLHTGDLGSLDTEGFLTLKDRSKDVIISGGSNIYPREVEEALIEHPDVREVCVVGRPDREWGEVVVAYVVPRAQPPDESALERLCVERIARFKRPRHYRFVEELPKNETGKVLRRLLREREASLAGSTGERTP